MQYGKAFIYAAASALPLVVAPPSAFATDYMTAADCQALMFPTATDFVAPVTTQLTPDQQKAISTRLGAMPNVATWNIWRAMKGTEFLGYVVTDAVIGKFQLINYAVALDSNGVIRDVEILSYRESHGGEVRTPGWRHQFNGKDSSNPIATGDDIANISGATLSCTHLADGIRRITAYVQLGLAKQQA